MATVQGNGNLLAGKAYTTMPDLKPGDEFEIKLGRKQIKQISAGGDEEDQGRSLHSGSLSTESVRLCCEDVYSQ